MPITNTKTLAREEWPPDAKEQKLHENAYYNCVSESQETQPPITTANVVVREGGSPDEKEENLREEENPYLHCVPAPKVYTKERRKEAQQNEEEKRGRFVYHVDEVLLGKSLGGGKFSTAMAGVIKSTGEKVAVKLLKKDTGYNDYKREMRNLLDVDQNPHRNILRFVGIMPLNGMQCFITEWCELGSLDKLHNKFDLTEKKMFFKIAHGIFCGVGHLHANNMIHRDIACRNLLVKNDFEVVIADFGLTVRAPNKTYKASLAERLPWRWTSPETMASGIFRFSSDVWATGVTLWELLSKGSIPFLAARGPREFRELWQSGKIKIEVPPSLGWALDVLNCCLHPLHTGRLKLSEDTWLDFVAVAAAEREDGGSDQAKATNSSRRNIFTEEDVDKRASQAVILERKKEKEEVIKIGGERNGNFSSNAEKKEGKQEGGTLLSNRLDELKEIQKKIKNLKKSDYSLLASIPNPYSKNIYNMASAVCILLGIQPTVKTDSTDKTLRDYWDAIRPRINLTEEPSLVFARVPGLKYMMQEQLSKYHLGVLMYALDWKNLSPATIKALRPYVEGGGEKNISIEKCRQSNPLAHLCSRWVYAMYRTAAADTTTMQSSFGEIDDHFIGPTLKYVPGGDVNGLWPRINRFSAARKASFNNAKMHIVRSGIGALKNLEALDLTGNNLVSLPAQISLLSMLKVLNLNNNYCRHLPPQIKSLSKLTTLHLQQNKLLSLPLEICTIPSLRGLYLQNNCLQQLPADVQVLRNLERLSLENNQLRSLPSEVKVLSKLHWLQLDNNSLNSLPSEVGFLENLNVLSVDGNRLTSLPETFKLLQNLRELSIADNNLPTFPLPLLSLHKVSHLCLDGNRISSIPAEIRTLTCLQKLALERNLLVSLPTEMSSSPDLILGGIHVDGNPAPEKELTKNISFKLARQRLGKLLETSSDEEED